MREKTILDVMREPVVSYTVTGDFDGGEESQPFESETEAVDAARMLASSGATSVTVERWTTRVVHDREEIDWQASDGLANGLQTARCRAADAPPRNRKPPAFRGFL